MLPNTSLIAPPSILIRVGSLSAIAASTDTPSRASMRWSASATGGLIASSNASRRAIRSNLAGAIGQLLEAFQLDPVAGVVEGDDVLLLDVGSSRAVDEGGEPPLEVHGQVVLFGHELRDREL